MYLCLNCETQPSSIQRLSSTIFPCLFVCPASVTSPLISTIWCFRPYKPYIFCKDMILATCHHHHIVIWWSSCLRFSWPSLDLAATFPGPHLLVGAFIIILARHRLQYPWPCLRFPWPQISLALSRVFPDLRLISPPRPAAVTFPGQHQTITLQSHNRQLTAFPTARATAYLDHPFWSTTWG